MGLLDEERQVATTALIDSGCTISCINANFVKKSMMTTQRLPQAIKARNADGSPNSHGDMTDYVKVRMRIGKHSEEVNLTVVNLGKEDMFLGHDWLVLHNPEINWEKGKVAFTRCPDECQKQVTPEIPLKEQVLQSLDFDNKAVRAFATKSTMLANEAGKVKVTLPTQYQEYNDVFAKESFDALPERRSWDHAIDIEPGSNTNINAKVYPLNPEEQKELDAFLQENLSSGRIRPSKSPLASPFFFVKKKDGRLRPVQDYRKLNKITVKNQYPLPLIPELLNKLQGATVFSKFDIRWGYNNVRIKEGDEWKAAFRTNRGLYKPLVMFFGLTNSPATFQAMMDDIFRDLILNQQIVVYMDDILIFLRTLQEHQSVVREVLQRLRKNKLFLKLDKSTFETEETDFLGVIVGKGRSQMDQIKTKAIDEWSTPKNLRELRSFVQFCNFYQHFIPNFATITKCFNTLTEKNQLWNWQAEHERSFQALKDAVQQDVTLKFPIENAQYCLEADASNLAVGAVLHQIIEGKPRPLGFFSKTLNQAERNYQIYDKELLAILMALKHWRHLLMGAPKFEIWSDHKNLTYYRKPRDLTRRQARWHQLLQEYNFTVMKRYTYFPFLSP